MRSPAPDAAPSRGDRNAIRLLVNPPYSYYRPSLGEKRIPGGLASVDAFVNDRRAFERMDRAPDAAFYREPRLVEHIDGAAIGAVTALYRETFAEGAKLLDLMSSWVSHLPPERNYAGVTGLGMNAEELAHNPRLTERIVHDLNEDPILPFDSGRFDGAANLRIHSISHAPGRRTRGSCARFKARRAARDHVFESLLSDESRGDLADARRTAAT